jgi:hypothetical protein
VSEWVFDGGTKRRRQAEGHLDTAEPGRRPKRSALMTTAPFSSVYSLGAGMEQNPFFYNRRIKTPTT